MSEIITDSRLPSCYHLFPKPGIYKSQRLSPDLFLPRAREGLSGFARSVAASSSLTYFETAGCAGLVSIRRVWVAGDTLTLISMRAGRIFRRDDGVGALIIPGEGAVGDPPTTAHWS